MKINGLEIVQIIMLTLKLLNKIDLSWGIVFIPSYIALGGGLAAVLIGIYQERKMERSFYEKIKKR